MSHPGPFLLLKHWTLSHTFNRWRKLAYIEKKLWKNFIQKTKRGRNHLHFESIEVYRRFFGEFRVFHLCSFLCYRFRFLSTSVSSHCKGGLISRIKKELSWWCLLGPQNQLHPFYGSISSCQESEWPCMYMLHVARVTIWRLFSWFVNLILDCSDGVLCIVPHSNSLPLENVRIAFWIL